MNEKERNRLANIPKRFLIGCGVTIFIILTIPWLMLLLMMAIEVFLHCMQNYSNQDACFELALESIEDKGYRPNYMENKR